MRYHKATVYPKATVYLRTGPGAQLVERRQLGREASVHAQNAPADEARERHPVERLLRIGIL